MILTRTPPHTLLALNPRPSTWSSHCVRCFARSPPPNRSHGRPNDQPITHPHANKDTAGVVLPKPVAECRYWHRSLNPRKLVDIGFSRISERQTMARLVKLYRLPDKPTTYGLRAMTAEDVPSACRLLNEYLKK